MDISQMKNIVVLKNLPSNMVEEAIVVLKPNIKVMQVEHAEKNINADKNGKIINPKDYIVKEAEMVIANCISNIENKKNQNIKNIKKLTKKYNRQRKLTFLLSGIMLLYLLIKILI